MDEELVSKNSFRISIEKARAIENGYIRSLSDSKWQKIESQRRPGEYYVGSATWRPDEPDTKQETLSRYKESYPGFKVRFFEWARLDRNDVNIAGRDDNTGLTQIIVAGVFVSHPTDSYSSHTSLRFVPK